MESLLCTELSLVSVSSFVVLCAVRWRESSVSRGLFTVYVPGTVCAFRSSCRPVDRSKIFFGAPCHITAECATAFVTVPQSGVCSCRIGSTLGKFTKPVHWMRRACSHGDFSFCSLQKVYRGSEHVQRQHCVNSSSLLSQRLPPTRPSAELASTIDAVLPNVFPSLRAQQR